MKTLQNNFTTPEQSKRLLELGLSADSADLYYCACLNKNKVPAEILSIADKPQVGTNTNEYPCWSVGRLIEILKICVTKEDEFVEILENLTYWTLQSLTDCLMSVFNEYKNVIDFSKLER